VNLNQMSIPSRSKECPLYFPVILCGLAALLASGLAAAVQQASVPTIQFTAESFTIQEGQSTTLRWKVDNAKTVSIQPVVVQLMRPVVWKSDPVLQSRTRFMPPALEGRLLLLSAL